MHLDPCKVMVDIHKIIIQVLWRFEVLHHICSSLHTARPQRRRGMGPFNRCIIPLHHHNRVRECFFPHPPPNNQLRPQHLFSYAPLLPHRFRNLLTPGNIHPNFPPCWFLPLHSKLPRSRPSFDWLKCPRICWIEPPPLNGSLQNRSI